MRPKYVEIVNDNPGHPNLPYRLFLYIEATNEINLQNENLNQSRFDIKFDYFCIDFAEELSAFSGQILERQVEYLTEIVKFLSGLYSSIGNKQEIILIGHSMGGIVAKGAVYMDHQLLAHADVPSAVKMVITLNTPHARCLGALDRKFEDLFSKIHQSHLSKIVRIPNGDAGANVVPPLISFSPGTRDIIVPSELSIVEESDLQFTLNVMTSEMPLVWASMEHQMSVWNFPFIKAVHIGLIFGLQNEKLRNRKNPSLSSKALLSDLSTYWKSGNIIDDEPDVSNIPAREVSYSSTKSGRDDIYYQEILLPANGDIYLDHNDLAGLIGNNRHFALILKSASSSAAQFSTSLQPVKDHIIIENITSIEVENGKLRAVSGLMGPHMNLPESFYPAGSKSFCLNSVYSSINIPFHSQLKRDIILPAMIIILPFRATSLDQSYMFLPPSHSVFESFSPFVNFSGSNSYLDSMVHSEETQFLSSKLNYHQKSRFSSLLSWASSPSSYISIISNKKSLPVDPSAAKLSVKLSFGLLDYFFAYFLNYDAISVASSSCSMSQIKISILNLRPKYQVLRLTVFLRAKSDVIANSPPNAIQAFFHSQVEKKYLDIKPESVVTRGGSNTYRFSHLISLQDAKPGAPLDPLIIKMLIDPRYEVHESILFTPEKLLGISLAFKWYFPWIMYFYPVIFCLFAVSLQASANSKLPDVSAFSNEYYSIKSGVSIDADVSLFYGVLFVDHRDHDGTGLCGV
ncbi:GPI inositol-deacylase [Mitosporidium daphniae]|uniref:GPI inositol-deacylase n=1 Tax=Mitosporidium daphniae TaxID=1485682 RepID=A0A098VVV6_9MICR|nr:GPI inositol-deacylase [Mitosporidium daphniae]KGG52989.1 GPI inositol-deacylase [Mitosporidium daphniae]|eukprot:XP_013239416.1 GPI inositol-deacylase [Mitosporidium daphniae]